MCFRSTILVVIFTLALVCPSFAAEHDHQQWDLVDVGRLISISRIEKDSIDANYIDPSDLDKAKEEAERVLAFAMDSLECTNMGNTREPEWNFLDDNEDVFFLFAGVDAIRCEYSPRQQLFPIAPSDFKKVCSQVHWKCDIIWIPDGDTTVWYINRSIEIPPRLVKKY